MFKINDLVEYVGSRTRDGFCPGEVYTVKAIFNYKDSTHLEVEGFGQVITEDVTCFVSPFPYGSTNTKIRRFTNTKRDMGFSIKLKLDTECECGKDKHRFASHSDWCPKWVSKN